MNKKPYALITGASRGIGAAIALRLAKDGYSILLNYAKNREAASSVKKNIESLGGECTLLPFDVADYKSVEAALAPYNCAENAISAIINNAGIRMDNLLFWMTKEEWDSVLKTNLDSGFYVIKCAISGMMAAKKGVIIQITSTSGEAGMPGQANYAASKAGQIGLTKALALELGKKNIRVNAVAPGFIETGMTGALPADLIKKQIPLQRFGRPEEVAGTVSFLCSEDASYITGEVISVNGGIHT